MSDTTGKVTSSESEAAPWIISPSCRACLAPKKKSTRTAWKFTPEASPPITSRKSRGWAPSTGWLGLIGDDENGQHHPPRIRRGRYGPFRHRSGERRALLDHLDTGGFAGRPLHLHVSQRDGKNFTPPKCGAASSSTSSRAKHFHTEASQLPIAPVKRSHASGARKPACA